MKKLICMVLISLVTVLLFPNLVSASETSTPVVRTVWENASTLTSFHQDGKISSTFFSFPKVIWNGSHWVDYIFNSSDMSGGIGSVYIKVCPTHTIIYNPDRTEEKIKDERWIVEWYDESAHMWRLDQPIKNEIGYTTNSSGVCFSRNSTLESISTLEVYYMLKKGSKLKISVRLTSTVARKYRIVWKLTGVSSLKAKWAMATENITSRMINDKKCSWIQFSGHNNTKTSLDWFDTYRFNKITEEWETCFQRLELDKNASGNNCQTKVFFGNFTVSKDESFYLDPSIITFNSTASMDGYIQQEGSTYPPEEVTSQGSFIGVGQQNLSGHSLPYRQYRGYVSFNTMSISSFACVSSAELKLNTISDCSYVDFDIRVMGGEQPLGLSDPLNVSDWDCGKSEVSAWNTANYPGDGIYVNLTIPSDQINIFGRTEFELVSSREGSVPTGEEFVVFKGGEWPEHEPKLEVTYYLSASIEEINGTNWYYKNASNDKAVIFLGGGYAYTNYTKIFSIDHPIAKQGGKKKIEFIDGLVENGFDVLAIKDYLTRYEGYEAWVVDAALWLIEQDYQYVFLFGLSGGGVVVASEIQKPYAEAFSAAVVASAPVDWTNYIGIWQSAHTASQANVNTSFISPEYDPPWIVPRTYEQMSRYYGNMTVGKEWNNWNGGHGVFPNTSKDTGEDLLTVVLNWYNAPHPQSALLARPNTPSTPSGSQAGFKDVSYSYTTSTTDPAGYDIKYRFSWGDGTHKITDWCSSGANATASHTWSRPGAYNVSVRAQDAIELWSDWSSPLTVTIDQNDAGSGGDAGNNFSAATYVNEEIYYHGNLYKSNPADTEDWYKFYVADGQNIYLTMTPQSNVDFHLHLYDPHGIWLYPLEGGHDGGDGETDWFSQDADMNGNWSVRIYGSESSEYTFYLSIQSGGGGGGRCPTLFVWNGTGYVDYGVIDIHDASGEDVVEEVSVETEDVGLHNYKAYFRLREGWPGLNFSESVIDQVKLYAVDSQGNRYLCPLISATHSNLGNVWLQLLFSDDMRSQILLLETIDLTFIVPYQDVQSFTFVIEGCNQFKQ